MNRQERINIFEDTMQLCKSAYAVDVEYSIREGMIYSDVLTCEPSDSCTVDVTRNTSFKEAVLRSGNGFKVGVLNFASGTNPGGGVVKGSSAQEECLCRESTLYPVISDKKFWKDFYQYHRNRNIASYSDRVIYTPDILVLKDSSGNLLDTKYPVDVFTCCAPNLREKPSNSMNSNAGKAVKLKDNDLLTLLVNRYTNLLNIVQSRGIDVFITGAIGCGAFQNKPYIVATAWRKALDASSFNGVCVFAVYCKKGEEENYNTFKRVLGK